MEKDIKTTNATEGENLGKNESFKFSINYNAIDRTPSAKQRDNFPSLGRISKALTDNMGSTPQILVNRYKHPISQIITYEGAVDRNGNIVKLSAMQNRILYSITKQLFSMKSEKVEEYLEKIKAGENPAQKVREYIILDAISKDIGGDEEKGKAKVIDNIYDELTNIAKSKQLQISTGGTITDENGREQEIIYRDFKPYINITGEETEVEREDGKTLRAVEIEFSRIFFERNWQGEGSRNFQISSSFFEAKKPNGKRIKTNVFWGGLLPLAMSLSWQYDYQRIKEVNRHIKKENIIDREKIAKLKENALTHPPIPIQRIKDIVCANSNHPQQKQRFNEYLWEAMWALIDRGLITDRSHIDWERETITLVFSETREPLREGERPGGEWTSYTPRKKSKKTKK